MRRMMIGCLGGLSRNVIDSFNRANSTTSLGNADTGQTWVNGVVTGNNIGISSNAAYSASAVDATASVGCVSANGDITIAASVVASNIGFVFRYSDSNNYCYGRFLTGSTRFYVLGKLSGSDFGGSSASGYYINGVTISNGDTIKINLSGNTLTLYVNGTSKGSLTITQNASNTGHGIIINGTTARIDSFEFIPA